MRGNYARRWPNSARRGQRRPTRFSTPCRRPRPPRRHPQQQTPRCSARRRTSQGGGLDNFARRLPLGGLKLTPRRRAAASAAAGYAQAQVQADSAREALTTLTGRIDKHSRTLDELHARVAAAEQAVAIDMAHFSALVAEAWWHRPQDETELGSAWVDTELQQLREKLFLAAMTLHETFGGSLASTRCRRCECGRRWYCMSCARRTGRR